MAISISLLFKSIIARGLYHSHLLDKKIADLHPVILGYHRVLPITHVPVTMQSGMYVTEKTFRKQMHFLADHFEVISLQSWINKTLAATPSKKPLCAITFDDGWIDTFTYAFPILKECNFHATVFLATDFINSHNEFWTDTLSHILSCKLLQKTVTPSSDTLNHELCKSIVSLKGSLDERIEKAITLVKPLPHKKKSDLIALLTTYFSPPHKKTQTRSFLTSEHINTMKESGLISFGSHTHTHPILTTISQKEADQELQTSKNFLLEHGICTPDFIPFCYPNGNYTSTLAESVAKHGYRTACITKSGIPHLPDNVYSLPRTLVHDDISKTKSLFAARLLNLI
jgi:peptidoglycan/xylan/chitin deacetylase (PgdA/CDA1 family)